MIDKREKFNWLIWVLSRPAVVLIDTKIKEMTGVQFSTSE